MAVPDKPGPGPLPAIVGGVLAAIVLFWLAGVVISAIAFFVRIAVVIALIAGGLWAWGKLSRD